MKCLLSQILRTVINKTNEISNNKVLFYFGDFLKFLYVYLNWEVIIRPRGIYLKEFYKTIWQEDFECATQHQHVTT